MIMRMVVAGPARMSPRLLVLLLLPWTVGCIQNRGIDVGRNNLKPWIKKQHAVVYIRRMAPVMQIIAQWPVATTATASAKIDHGQKWSVEGTNRYEEILSGIWMNSVVHGVCCLLSSTMTSCCCFGLITFKDRR